VAPHQCGRLRRQVVPRGQARRAGRGVTRLQQLSA
jgi:hypothetical protein